nr:AMP-binding protein [Kineobactrum salinum]
MPGAGLDKNKVLATSHFIRDEHIPLVEEPIGATLLKAAEQFGEKIALVDGQIERAARRTWTYAELAEEARKVASALLQHFQPGQRVAIWSASSPEWVLIEFGASLAGLVLVTVNPAYLAHELKYVLRQSRAHGIILQDCHRGRDLGEVLQEVRAELPDLDVVIPLSTWDAFLASAQLGTLPEVEAGDLAQIQYTSGTTGFPKGPVFSTGG